MQLAIHSLTKTLFQGEVKCLILPTREGQITILDNHIPLISIVKAGNVQYDTASNQRQTLTFPGGFLEVQPGSNVVLLAKEGPTV